MKQIQINILLLSKQMGLLVWSKNPSYKKSSSAGGRNVRTYLINCKDCDETLATNEDIIVQTHSDKVWLKAMQSVRRSRSDRGIEIFCNQCNAELGFMAQNGEYCIDHFNTTREHLRFVYSDIYIDFDTAPVETTSIF